MRPCLFGLCVLLLTALSSRAGELVVQFEGPRASDITSVGAIVRWDADGNPKVPVDPKAKIDQPRVDAQATKDDSGRWVFAKLPTGRYDLVILMSVTRTRLEGFTYPPVAEFDPFLDPNAKPPEDDDRDAILKDIKLSRHYENKVVPLALAGDAKMARVFMQLVRDDPTSFDAEYGKPVATVRHEVWQYTNRYGSWSKERATRVFDRVLLPRADLHRWTWVWDRRLGGVQIDRKNTTLSLSLPDRFDPSTNPGWVAD